MVSKAKTLSEIYAEECTAPRPKPNMAVDDDLQNKIASHFRTLPTFEKTLFDEIYIKYYSMKTNEFLNCRWKLYKKNAASIKRMPFQFPKNGDLHFYNHTVRFTPHLSLDNIESFRKTLKPGPGVDHHGQQRVIPKELYYKRGFEKTKRPPVLISKRKRKDDNEGDEKGHGQHS